MITVMLYGSLGAKFGKVHRLAISTPMEAFRALAANYKEFRETLDEIGNVKVLVGGKNPITKHIDLLNPQSEKETIRIIPVVQGAGDDGLFSIALGVALIWATGGFGAGTGLGVFSSGGALAGMAAGVGAFGMSLVLGGVSQLLFSPSTQSPTDQTRDAVENKANKYFDGVVNTMAQGNAVPVCYGELIVGSQVISAGLTTEQV